MRVGPLAVLVATVLSIGACSSPSDPPLPSSAVSGTRSAPSATASAVAGTASATPAASASADAASVPIKLVAGPDGRRVPVVQVSVGGGKAAIVILDTGSVGLLLDADAIGKQAHPTDRSLTKTYIGFALHARVDTATVSFLGGSRSATTKESDVGAVSGALAPFVTAVGADGILGVAAGENGSSEPDLHSPLADLPGALADGYLVDLRAGRLSLGAPPSGGTSIPLHRAAWHYPNGLPGYEKAVPVAWSIDGRRKTVPTTLDTGAANGQIARQFFPNAPTGSSGLLPDGTTVALTTDRRPIVNYVVGRGRVPAPHVSSGQAVMNSGISVFLANRIGLDLRGGRVAIEPY